MPSLRDVQHHMHRALVGGDDAAIARLIAAQGVAPSTLVDIHRNTMIGTLTRALRLNFPAVERLVGDDCFAAAARAFIGAAPPASPWLDAYGEGFSAFLAEWSAAGAVPYVADVAHLEWGVARALHAEDADALDLVALGALSAEEQASVRLVPHPALRLIRTTGPADAIWRAVLARDDAALAAIDISAGARFLLVQRVCGEIEIVAMGEPEWRFTADLCAGRPLQEALDAAPAIDAPTLLGRHFAAGRFAGFRVAEPRAASR